MQRWVWTHVNKLDGLLPLFLDVALERAVSLGVHTGAAERIIDSLGAFSSPNLRGKLLARLRAVCTTVQLLMNPVLLVLDALFFFFLQ